MVNVRQKAKGLDMDDKEASGQTVGQRVLGAAHDLADQVERLKKDVVEMKSDFGAQITALSEHIRKSSESQEKLVSMMATIEAFFLAINKLASWMKPIGIIAVGISALVGLWSVLRPFWG